MPTLRLLHSAHTFPPLTHTLAVNTHTHNAGNPIYSTTHSHLAHVNSHARKFSHNTHVHLQRPHTHSTHELTNNTCIHTPRAYSARINSPIHTHSYTLTHTHSAPTQAHHQHTRTHLHTHLRTHLAQFKNTFHLLERLFCHRSPSLLEVRWTKAAPSHPKPTQRPPQKPKIIAPIWDHVTI